MLRPILRWILGLLWPNAPRFALPIVLDLFDLVREAVREADGFHDKSGPDKRQWVIEKTAKVLDRSLDALPEWRQAGEPRQNAILRGFVELALLIERAASRDPKGTRRAVRGL